MQLNHSIFIPITSNIITAQILQYKLTSIHYISNDNKRMISKIKKVSPDKKKYKKFKDEYISFPNYENKKRWKEISNKLKTLN